MIDPASIELLQQRNGPEDWIYIVIGVIYLLWSIFKPLLKRFLQSDDKEGSTASGVEIGDLLKELEAPQPQTTPRGNDEESRGRGKEKLEAVISRATTLQTAIQELIAEIELTPSMFHFVAPLEANLQPQVAELVRGVHADLRAIDALGTSAVEQRTTRYERYIRYYNSTLRLITKILRSRDARAVRDLLADADRVADRCFDPMRSFAETHFDNYPVKSAVCLLEGRDLAVSNQLAAAGLALIHLPDDFAQNVTLWPAIAHEIGHVAYLTFPGLAEEFTRLMPGRPAQQLFWVTQQLTSQHIDELIATWAEELFADIFGAMQFGPAYIIGQTTQFGSVDEPRLAALIGVNGARYDEHPPPQLRILVASQALEYLGYGTAAHKVVERWDKLHGGRRADYFLPGIEGNLVAIDAEVIEEPVRDLVARVLDYQFATIGGYSLRSVPGLAFAENQHYGAVRDVEQMIAGDQVSHLDPREMVAAIVYLAAQGGYTERDLATLLRRSVVGLGVGEHAETPEYRTRPGRAAADPQAWFEAVVLHDVLRRSGLRL
ncbi:MAG: hypothetical protein KC609_24870 [Myxococcales bacterium]|nr:hypothetical protein [Myxococcales bacterium]